MPEWKRIPAKHQGSQSSSEKTFSQKLESQQNLIKGQRLKVAASLSFADIRLRPNYDEPEAWVSPPDAAALRGSRDA